MCSKINLKTTKIYSNLTSMTIIFSGVAEPYFFFNHVYVVCLTYIKPHGHFKTQYIACDYIKFINVFLYLCNFLYFVNLLIMNAR